jgi:N-acetylneuraminate synthase
MKMNEINIRGRKIGRNYEPFIIAEMSGNHNQSLDRALEIVDAAADCGVDALKIQTYTADTMTLDLVSNEFVINAKDSLWSGQSLYELYKIASTPWEWHKAIKDRCTERGILFFSTPFDATAVEFLEELDVDFYKVASFENTDLPLIRKIAHTGKPLIISTGMANISELHEMVHEVHACGNPHLVLLKCTSAYPSTPKEANILTIPHLRSMFNVEVGLSDHTMGIGVALAAIAHGASVIEKHFTLRRADGGVDSAFSLEPAELKLLVEESKRVHQSLGEVCYRRSPSEEKSLQFRRSLYFIHDMQAGEIITDKSIRAIRPGLGLPPKHISQIIGKSLSKDVSKGTPVSWNLI